MAHHYPQHVSVWGQLTISTLG